MGLNTNQKIFNKFFADDGGIFDVDKLSKDDAAVYNLYRQRADKYIESCRQHPSRFKDIPEIHFDFINNASLNAVAALSNDGIYLIGIHSGTIFILYDLFLRMLSHSNILEKSGNPNEEKSKSPPITNYYSDAGLLASRGKFGYDDYKLPRPKNVPRLDYANHLLDIAVDFIVAHELTHVVNGHLGFVNVNSGINFIEERTQNIHCDQDILNIQALEMDADCMAVSKGLANVVKRYQGQQNVSNSRKEFYTDFESVVFNWALSVLTVIRLMNEVREYKNVDSKSISHPHPRVRSAMILTTVDTYLREYYPGEYSFIDEKKLISDVVIEVETTYKYITGNHTDKKEYSDQVESGSDYIRQVNNTWRTIRNELTQHSFFELT